MPRTPVTIFFVLLASCMIAFSQSQEPVNIVKWQPKFEFNGELFPSVVLTMNGRATNVSLTPRQRAGVWWVGDQAPIAAVQITPVVPNTRVHVAIQIDGFTDDSTLDAVLPESGQHYVVAPVLRYKYDRLASTQQSVPATVAYSVEVNGSPVSRQTLNIRVRSVNDVPFEMVRADGQAQDLSVLFAGYVNESHPFVQTVLQEALQYHAVNSFDGYQGGPQNVRLQVFALWNVLQRHHLHYSSITTPSAASATGHVFSQSVRFIDESIQSQQANCVDGSVLFASLLYKISIHPILVLKPGHMFVGYYLDAGHKQLEFLETTMLGAGHQPSTMNVAFSPLLHPIQGSESWRQFVQAIQVATNTFNQEVVPSLQQHKPQYRLIDVAKARQEGVNAIPRPVR